MKSLTNSRSLSSAARPARSPSMFDRLNDTARRVVARAGEEERALGQARLGTTHLLLAFTSTLTGDGEPNKAAEILQDVFDVAVLREQILAPMPRGVEP